MAGLTWPSADCRLGAYGRAMTVKNGSGPAVTWGDVQVPCDFRLVEKPIDLCGVFQGVIGLKGQIRRELQAERVCHLPT